MNFTSPANIALVVLVATNVFQVYLYFRNPQVDMEKKYISLVDGLAAMQKEIKDIKETNIISINKNVTELSSTVKSLEISVAKLSTVIDERIPKKV